MHTYDVGPSRPYVVVATLHLIMTRSLLAGTEIVIGERKITTARPMIPPSS